jgi:LmbE family N-acetylglucosaminyl deacetylase
VERPLTLMAVHAHPDDEASSTGGLLARSAAEGIRTVLVTCTDGALGDDREGAKPNTPGHDRTRVVATRRRELEASCAILGVEALELLGYPDSGMIGWPENDAPGSFWSRAVGEAAQPLIALIESYRPQVVVTYDANGFYGHPDHIQAHRVTMAAVEATEVVDKVYFPTFPRSMMPAFFELLRESGVEVPEPAEGEPAEPEFGTPDEEVSAWLDCRSYAARKHEALFAHASQAESTFFVKIARERFIAMFGIEAYVRHFDRTGAALPESDLFAGLR